MDFIESKTVEVKKSAIAFVDNGGDHFETIGSLNRDLLFSTVNDEFKLYDIAIEKSS